MEIERKFLVDGRPPELALADGVRIDQGYLAIGDGRRGGSPAPRR